MNAISLALAPAPQGHKIASHILYPLYPNGDTVNDWMGSSHLEELAPKVEKRYGGGFSMLTAFTWQKPVATTGGYRDPAGNRNLEAGASGSGNKLRLISFDSSAGRRFTGFHNEERQSTAHDAVRPEVLLLACEKRRDEPPRPAVSTLL